MRCQHLVGSVIIAIYCCLPGCDRSKSSQGRDPVVTFKAIVGKVAALNTSRLIEDKEPFAIKLAPTGDQDFDSKNSKWWQDSQQKFAQGLRWRRIWSSTKDQTFDIQKTDSLVSPVTGYIEFKLYEVGSDRLTQSNAEIATEDHCVSQTTDFFRVEYTFQDNIWVLKSILRKDEPSEWEPDPQWKPDDYPVTIDALHIALTDAP